MSQDSDPREKVTEKVETAEEKGSEEENEDTPHDGSHHRRQKSGILIDFSTFEDDSDDVTVGKLLPDVPSPEEFDPSVGLTAMVKSMSPECNDPVCVPATSTASETGPRDPKKVMTDEDRNDVVSTSEVVPETLPDSSSEGVEDPAPSPATATSRKPKPEIVGIHRSRPSSIQKAERNSRHRRTRSQEGLQFEDRFEKTISDLRAHENDIVTLFRQYSPSRERLDRLKATHGLSLKMTSDTTRVYRAPTRLYWVNTYVVNGEST